MMSKKGTGKFILGAAIGAGLALLFAPAKGSETRKQLAKKFDELKNKIQEIDLEEVKDDLENKIEEIKSELEDLNKEKVLKIAKEKAKDIKNKTEEIVELAVEKGTPVVWELIE